MGSQLSQSQQLRNTFPLSQYKIIPSDPYYPELTFIQRLSDSLTFAVCVIDKGKQTYQVIDSRHVIKRIQRKQINKKIYELYEWANTNVQGLVEYINSVDNNRKISKSQFNAIVEGAVKGYSAISKGCFQIQCLDINMRNLRIFNEVSLKVNANNSTKQIVNSISVKVLPNNLHEYLQKSDKDKGQKLWNHIGKCIHQGGILTQKQLLGYYLIELSNYVTKQAFKNKTDCINNIKSNFGVKTYHIVSALMGNDHWKNVIKILQQQQTINDLPLKQIQNHQNKKYQQLVCESHKSKQISSQKTIDTTNKSKSENVLFECFKKESEPSYNKHQLNHVNIIKQTCQKSHINSSVSPLKPQKYYSPPSLKIIRQVTPHNFTKEQSKNDFNKVDTTKLTRTNSILTIFPDVFREQQNQRNRILSTRNIFAQQLYSSPLSRNINTYISPPKLNKSPSIRSPRYQTNNISPRIIKNQKNHPQNIQKRKGKKIQFKPLKQNPTLKQHFMHEYQTKIKPDMIEMNNKQQVQINQQHKKNDSFLSQEFNGLKFQLSDKYFNSKSPSSVKNILKNGNNQVSLIKTQQKSHEKLNTQILSKINNNQLSTKQAKDNKTQIDENVKHNNSIKPKYLTNYYQKQNKYLSSPKDHRFTKLNIKQTNSQVFLIQQQHIIHSKKPDLSNNKTSAKQSKYIGPVNLNGQKQGEGKLYFPSGGLYIGNFSKDFMHGNGKLYYPSGKLAYQGTFNHDKFHGYGKLYNQHPTYIQAFDFRNFNLIQVNEKHRPLHKQHSLFINPNLYIFRQKKNSYWKYYQGEMRYDMKHGKGVWVLENGERYEGEFNNDLVDGTGVFYGNSGRIQGRWEGNVLVEAYR